MRDRSISIVRFTNWRRCASGKHLAVLDDELPGERTLRDILIRMNYRLKRIQKGKPLNKTEHTDAIFDNLKKVRSTASADPGTLEISVDTKARVKLGEYSQGGDQDRQRRKRSQRMGS